MELSRGRISDFRKRKYATDFNQCENLECARPEASFTILS